MDIKLNFKGIISITFFLGKGWIWQCSQKLKHKVVKKRIKNDDADISVRCYFATTRTLCSRCSTLPLNWKYGRKGLHYHEKTKLFMKFAVTSDLIFLIVHFEIPSYKNN